MLTRTLAAAGALAAVMSLTPAVPARADSRWAGRLAADFLAAHQVTRGKGVTVALLSTGVDDKVGSLRGVVDKGKDLVGTPRPKKTFGTMMASWIAGTGPTHDNPFGIRGLASASRILPVRVYPDDDDIGRDEWFGEYRIEEVLAEGIRYAADQGAQVIALQPTTSSTSRWDDDFDDELRDALAHARSKKAVVVAPSTAFDDKAGDTRFAYPAAAPGVIGVGALDTDGERYGEYSQESTSVLVSAPGFVLPAIGPGDRLMTYWGSFPAVTWVASTAALIKAEYPGLTPAQVALAIGVSARHPEGQGSYDPSIGFGVVNPDGALKEARRLADQGRPRLTATTGTAPDKTHFGGGAPARIAAVQHQSAATVGFPALMVAGLLALAGAFRMFRRRPVPVAGDGAERSESGDAAGA